MAMNCRDISHRSVPRIPRGNDFKLANIAEALGCKIDITEK